jgi:hypothetical protein
VLPQLDCTPPGALRAGTHIHQVGLVRTLRDPPATPRTRQNATPIGNSLGGAHSVVASPSARSLAHNRSAHTSTCAPVTPSGKTHFNRGVRDVTRAVLNGAIARGTLTSQLPPTISRPAPHGFELASIDESPSITAASLTSALESPEASTCGPAPDSRTVPESTSKQLGDAGSSRVPQTPMHIRRSVSYRCSARHIGGLLSHAVPASPTATRETNPTRARSIRMTP